MTFILTRSGQHFDPLNPDPNKIVVLDLACALSKMCRFNGHTLGFYSVAQHSVFVANLVAQMGEPIEVQQAALLHDASEAYIADVTTPVKPHLTNYREIEGRIIQALGYRFDIDVELFDCTPVKYADKIALATEKRDLMPKDSTPWPVLRGIPEADEIVRPKMHTTAAILFYEKAVELELADPDDLDFFG